MRFAVLAILLVPLPRVAAAGNASGKPCPCADGDLNWNDDEDEYCYAIVTSLRFNPKGYPNSEATAQQYRDRLRKCIAFRRKEVDDQARLRKEAEAKWAQEAKEQEDARRARAEARAQQAAEDARKEEERDRKAGDPGWMQPVLSALICYDTWLSQSSLKEIRTEQAYAKKGGGMVDKAKIYDLQVKMREADESRVKALASLRRLKVNPLACSAKGIDDLVWCMRSDPDSCAIENVKERVSFVEVP